jgi:predicted phosphodiesterase
MSKTRIIGDVHGLQYELRELLESMPNDVKDVIQVGDMGVGFGQGDYWHESLEEIMLEKNLSFIRGNHDNPQICKKMTNWIPDGTVVNDVMFIGGAWSIDHRVRTPGHTWWFDEELNDQQFLQVIDTFKMAKPRVMITHDCPFFAARSMFFDSKIIRGAQYKTRTAMALEEMYTYHQPEFHFFGHWHYSINQKINNTQFVCLNEMDYIDVNLDDSVSIQSAIDEKFTRT